MDVMDVDSQRDKMKSVGRTMIDPANGQFSQDKLLFLDWFFDPKNMNNAESIRN